MNQKNKRAQRRHFLIGAGVGLVLPGLAIPDIALGQADNWPSKPIRLVVPSAPGGAADFVGRTFGRYLEAQIKQTVIVDNKPGANAIIGAEAVKSAAPDGYTYLVAGNSTQSGNSAIFAKLPYDPAKDFEEVGMFGPFPTVALVKKGSPFLSVADLIAYAKANPGKLKYGYASASSQIPSELIKSRAGIDAVGAPYKNITQIITDLVGGVLDFSFLDALTAAPALQTGLLTPIAVTSPKAFPLLPMVATVADVLPGFEMQGWLGLAAPVGTPRPILEKMNSYIRSATLDPTVKAALEHKGMSVQSLSLSDHKAFVQADRQRWIEWVRIAKIPPQ